MRWLWLYLTAGTVVRIAYAAIFHPWWGAADHLSWAIVLKSIGHVEGLHYWQFVHYPQEGGSIPVSLIALLIGKVSGLPALPCAALLVDAFSRWVQLKVVSLRFDPSVFHLFGAWTIAGLPILITWSSVNCGLHSLSSFFPFALMWLIGQPKAGVAQAWIDGLCLGLSVWFTYDCLLLLPVYLVFWRSRFLSVSAAMRAGAVFIAVIAVHLMVRYACDPGFHLPGWGAASVRGLDFQRSMGSILADMAKVWTHALPGSSLLPELLGVEVRVVRWLWALFVLAGAIGCIRATRRDPGRRRLIFGCLLCVVAFALGYAASPVVVHQPDHPSYMYYRHWAFILPMIALITLVGLAASRTGRLVAWCFVVFNAMGTMLMFRGPVPTVSNIRDTGFVLALKLGHDPGVLGSVIENVPDLTNELFFGAGWGTTEELLVFNGPARQDTDRLIELLKAYPAQQRERMLEGVEFAFTRNGPGRISMATRETVRDALGMPTPENTATHSDPRP